MSDPFRHDPTLQCPRCQGFLRRGGEGIVCDRNCGEWIDERGLQGLSLDELGTADGKRRVDPIASCASCRRIMKPRSWGAALFDVCPRHGIWIDDWYRVAFRMRLSEALDQKRTAEKRAAEEAQEQADVEKLLQQLAESTEDGRRALARRVIAIERRLDKLEKKLR